MFKALLNRLGATRSVAIPEPLWRGAIEHLLFIAALDEGNRQRLRALTEQLLANKEMGATGNLDLTAEMQVTIAVQACLPILNLGIEWYRGWSGIVVYPAEFQVPREVVDDDGVVHEFTDTLAGEAWDGGPLLLSWADACGAQPQDGPWSLNVVIHEFTHKIDMLNGDPDGCPPLDRHLHAQIDPHHWQQALADAYERFCAELDMLADELPSGIDPDSPAADAHFARLPLDPYAAQDEGEFFAVSSEQFFVDPARLRDAFPEWYELLVLFFRQDPAARLRQLSEQRQ
jgi:Mlc titration factor MtfA (ptsG expression regulator)